MPGSILDVQGLEVAFKTPDGGRDAFNDISFSLTVGQTFNAVGEGDIQAPCTRVPVVFYAARPH